METQILKTPDNELKAYRSAQASVKRVEPGKYIVKLSLEGDPLPKPFLGISDVGWCIFTTQDQAQEITIIDGDSGNPNEQYWQLTGGSFDKYWLSIDPISGRIGGYSIQVTSVYWALDGTRMYNPATGRTASRYDEADENIYATLTYPPLQVSLIPSN